MYKFERIMDFGDGIQGVHDTGSCGVSRFLTDPGADGQGE
jgi:hypothetical protein